jgi:hypothetical protein
MMLTTEFISKKTFLHIKHYSQFNFDEIFLWRITTTWKNNFQASNRAVLSENERGIERRYGRTAHARRYEISQTYLRCYLAKIFEVEPATLQIENLVDHKSRFAQSGDRKLYFNIDFDGTWMLLAIGKMQFSMSLKGKAPLSPSEAKLLEYYSGSTPIF